MTSDNCKPSLLGAFRSSSPRLGNLSKLVYGAKGFTIWHYRSRTDSVETLMRPGYFADAHTMLAEGDIIILVGRNGGRLALVAMIDSSSVSLSPLF